jgi:hypothetical protein
MHESVEPQDVPKKKLPPLVIIIGIIFALCIVFLLLPSSRSSKIAKAKARLETTFNGPPASKIQSIYEEFLVAGSESKRLDLKPTDASFIYVFAPAPTYTGSQMFGDLSNQYGYRSGEKKNAVLLAPDPASKDWSLLSKDWIAYGLLNKKVEEIRALGQEMTYSSGSKTIQPRLKKIWDSIPAATQAQAEAILTKNRAAAKKLGENRRFFQDGKGKIYEIRAGNDIWDFVSTYEDVFPSPPRKNP